MARRHIRMANVVVLVMDATEGVLGLDATIAGYAHEGGRPVDPVQVNKWDLLTDDKQFAFEESIRFHLASSSNMLRSCFFQRWKANGSVLSSSSVWIKTVSARRPPTA